MDKVLFSSKSDDWETPQLLFDNLNKIYNFTLDPCASYLNHKCGFYYNKIHNGLQQSWENEIVFMNPPYSRNNLKLWIKKAHDEVLFNNCKLVIALIPARTDTIYFHDYIYNKFEIQFLKGRIKFL